jgi:hypothetical protein
VLSNLKINDSLLEDLKSIDWRQQAPVDWSKRDRAFDIDYIDKLKNIITSKIPLWYAIKFYGIFFQKISNILTIKISTSLEEEIYNNWPFLKNMPEPPIIRLQIVYGGSRVPLHIDKTRSVSLIYPLKNHNTAITNFYKSNQKYPRRGSVNPKTCELVDSIKISQDPVLLNVDQIHDVVFPTNKIDIKDARISLNLKWERMKFEEVLYFFNDTK